MTRLKFRSFLLLTIFLIVGVNSNANLSQKLSSMDNSTKTPIDTKKGYPYTLNRQEYLLKACIDYNYDKLGAYKPNYPKDFSTLKENYKVEMPANFVSIFHYTEANANFYQEDYSDLFSSHEMISPPYNAIFARCVDFSKSKVSTRPSHLPHA